MKRYLFWVILGLTVILRYIGLAKGYHSDEGWLLGIAQVPLSDLLEKIRSGSSVYPPLSPILLHLWMKVSHSELWVRSYFVMFGTLLSILMYFFGVQVKGQRFGLLVFFFAAISPLFIWTSQFVRSYIDAAFWITLSSYLALKLSSRGAERRGISWLSLGYILSSIAALYTSYINGVILMAQTIVVLLLYGRNFQFLKRWFSLQVVVGLLFLPCLFILSDQLALARAVDAGWGTRGFILFGLKIGLMVRSVAAIIGMDPNFLTTTSLVSTISFPLLVLSALGVGLLGLWLLIRAVRLLPSFVWLLLLCSWGGYLILVQWFHFPSQAEYYVAHHALGLLVLSAVVIGWRRRWISVVLICGVTVTFGLRYADAIRPEFETKKAADYLEKHVEKDDCVWVIRSTNRYISPDRYRYAVLSVLLNKRADAASFDPLDQEALNRLNSLKQTCPRVWFQRMYANDEILGANKLIMDWLVDNHYKRVQVQHFKRIDIILYKGG